MPVGTNLERRGALYYWRRRIPPRLAISVGRSHLRMSLRTKERAHARVLAAHLDATAMDVFMSADSRDLSQQQLDQIFQQALCEHKRKLATIRAMDLKDGLTDPDLLAQEDRAAGLAYGVIARRGASATITESERKSLIAVGETDATIGAVEVLLGEMRRSGQTSASVQRLTALIETAGALATPANVAVAERTYLRALADALLASAAAYGGHDAAAGVMHVATEPLTTIVAEDGNQIVRDFPGAPAIKTNTAATRRQGKSPSPGAKREGFSGTIKEVAAELIRRKAKEDWTPKTQAQAAMIFELFDRFIRQERQLAYLQDLRQVDIVEFDRLLDIIPKSFGKSPKDKSATIADIRLSAASKKPGEIGLAPGTRNRHITFLTMLLATADTMGILLADKLSFKGFRTSGRKRARDEKQIPSAANVEALFRHPIFTGCRDWDRIHDAGPMIYHRAAYFGPLLAHYHGLRREEFCGLEPPRVRRRPFGLSHAAMAGSSSMA